MKLTQLPLDTCVEIETVEQLNSVSHLLGTPFVYEHLPFGFNFLKRNQRVMKGTGVYISTIPEYFDPIESKVKSCTVLQFNEIELC